MTICKHYGKNFTFVITGDESLIHKDIYKIDNYIKEKGNYAYFPAELDPILIESLQRKGINKFYSHLRVDRNIVSLHLQHRGKELHKFLEYVGKIYL